MRVTPMAGLCWNVRRRSECQAFGSMQMRIPISNRSVVTRVHRVAPSLEGQPVPVIEARLKEEEDDILKQLHTLDERLGAWQRAD